MAPPPEWRLPEDAPVVAFVGRLDRQKNPLLLLRAAARVVREVPETVFAFAGTGRLEARCKAEADRLGLSEQRPLAGMAVRYSAASRADGPRRAAVVLGRDAQCDP